MHTLPCHQNKQTGFIAARNTQYTVQNKIFPSKTNEYFKICFIFVFFQLFCQCGQIQATLCQYLIWEESGSCVWTQRGSCTTLWVYILMLHLFWEEISAPLTLKHCVCFSFTKQRQKDREDCLFQRIWLNLSNQRDVFYSTSGGRLLRLEAAELRGTHQEHPGPSPGLVEQLLGPLAKRHRRSEGVNPSDPLRSQPSHSATDHQDVDQVQPDQDQAGAVSKETITSCDDPLRVLQPNGPVSPVKTNIADRAEQE